MNRPNLVVGLTGGMATGKSVVSDRFRQLGASIIDTDILAREVVAYGQPTLAEIVHRFGTGLLDAHGNLNRGALRERIFQCTDDRLALEAIVHPRIRERSDALLDTVDTPYAILVIPLLFETDRRHTVDRVLVVDAPTEVQLHRARLRDRSSEAVISGIIAAQIDRMQRQALADDLIENNGPESELDQKVLILHQHYLRLSQIH